MMIMAGATVISSVTVGPAGAIVRLITGVAAAFVAYGHWRLAPGRGSRRTS
jgi:hypothetical protein